MAPGQGVSGLPSSVGMPHRFDEPGIEREDLIAEPRSRGSGDPWHRVHRTAAGARVIPRSLIVTRLAGGVAANVLAEWAGRHGFEVASSGARGDSIVHLRADGGRHADPFAAAEAVRASGLVAWAEPDCWVEAAPVAESAGGAPSRRGGDTPPLLAWHLNNTGLFGGTAGADIDALAAWDVTVGSESLVIAVLSDGVDRAHPHLTLWVNGDEPVDGVDSDGNGYVDDRFGWDFADGDNDPSPTAFVPPFDVPSHSDILGTAYAGLIAAFGSAEAAQTLASSGVVQRGQIMAIRLFAAGQFTAQSAHAAAIRYAADNGADVIVLPYAVGLPSLEVEAALAHAASAGRGGRGCAILAAAGDSGQAGVSWPGSSPWTAAVGATTNTDARAMYGQTGEALALCAPSGGGTLSLHSTDVTAAGRGFTTGITTTPLDNPGLTGTGSAAAIAAGVAGLALAANPNLTAGEIQTLLRASCDRTPPGLGGDYDVRGFGTLFGWGRLSAQRAVERAVNPAPLDDAYEPNDSLGEAVEPALPLFQPLMLRDDDWFRVSVPPLAILEAVVWHPATQGPPALELRLLDGTAIRTGVLRPDSAVDIHLPNGAEAQTFLVRIAPGAGQAVQPCVLGLRLLTFDVWESNNAVADPAPIIDPTPGDPFGLAASIDPPGDIDVFAIRGTAGDAVTVETIARRLPSPSPLDSVVSILRGDGTTLLAQNDDFDQGDSRVVATLPSNDTYYVIVHDAFGGGGPAHIYGLTLAGFTPSLVSAAQVADQLLGLAPLDPLADNNRDLRLDASDLTTAVNGGAP